MLVARTGAAPLAAPRCARGRALDLGLHTHIAVVLVPDIPSYIHIHIYIFIRVHLFGCSIRFEPLFNQTFYHLFFCDLFVAGKRTCKIAQTTNDNQTNVITTKPRQTMDEIQVQHRVSTSTNRQQQPNTTGHTHAGHNATNQTPNKATTKRLKQQKPNTRDRAPASRSTTNPTPYKPFTKQPRQQQPNTTNRAHASRSTTNPAPNTTFTWRAEQQQPNTTGKLPASHGSKNPTLNKPFGSRLQQQQPAEQAEAAAQRTQPGTSRPRGR